ncbi:MAG TPA: TMEM175 family protein [Faecalibacter sp.]
MTTNRLEAFSDGVLAIILTIMVLELKIPLGDDLNSLKPFIPKLLNYLLSFIFIGIYWNNHHHLFHAIEKIDGRTLWANLALLFWLSLLPVATGWLDEHIHSKWPAAVYGFILLMSSISFRLIEYSALRIKQQSNIVTESLQNQRKENITIIVYLLGIGIAFIQPEVSIVFYILVILMWVIPDQRIEKTLNN